MPEQPNPEATTGPQLLDGAWGTELLARGLAPGQCAEAWNLTHPEVVRKVGEAYVEAGSDIILTNTFCGNRLMLQRYGLGEQADAVNRARTDFRPSPARRSRGEL